MEKADRVLELLNDTNRILATMQTDMGWIKEDLAEHKEGVIQNRNAIARNSHFISQLIGAGKLLGLLSVVFGLIAYLKY